MQCGNVSRSFLFFVIIANFLLYIISGGFSDIIAARFGSGFVRVFADIFKRASCFIVQNFWSGGQPVCKYYLAYRNAFCSFDCHAKGDFLSYKAPIFKRGDKHIYFHNIYRDYRTCAYAYYNIVI